METLIKLLDAIGKLAEHSDKLVPLVLSLAVLAAIVVIGLHGGSK